MWFPSTVIKCYMYTSKSVLYVNIVCFNSVVYFFTTSDPNHHIYWGSPLLPPSMRLKNDVISLCPVASESQAFPSWFTTPCIQKYETIQQLGWVYAFFSGGLLCICFGVRLIISFKVPNLALEVFYGISEGRYVGVLG